MRKQITLKQILDLIDADREGVETVGIFEGHQERPSRVWTNSKMLRNIENRYVNSIGAEHSEILIWLEDEEAGDDKS